MTMILTGSSVQSVLIALEEFTNCPIFLETSCVSASVPPLRMLARCHRGLITWRAVNVCYSSYDL